MEAMFNVDKVNSRRMSSLFNALPTQHQMQQAEEDQVPDQSRGTQQEPCLFTPCATRPRAPMSWDPRQMFAGSSSPPLPPPSPSSSPWALPNANVGASPRNVSHNNVHPSPNQRRFGGPVEGNRWGDTQGDPGTGGGVRGVRVCVEGTCSSYRL